MSAKEPLDDLFGQGRPPLRSVEIDRLVGALLEQFRVEAPTEIRVGRYRLEERLGAGGLGLVYRASDPTLCRSVAIKVLKETPEDPRQDAALLREAQVLAQVRHHNVVEVFDVGFFDDHGARRFFVAMELVEGTTLRVWLQQGPSLAAIVDMFAACALGLCAVHDKGLLHRDFKPANALVSRDGVVKVADFGLAAVSREILEQPASAISPGPLDAVTPSWRPSGTPAYMAPEQHLGRSLTQHCDQFAFCVSLFEAIYGRRPFASSDPGGLLAAKMRGAIFPSRPPVPRRLVALMRRGLANVPEHRFESMAALHEALVRARPSRARAARLALFTGAAVAASVGVIFVSAEAPHDEACGAPARDFADEGSELRDEVLQSSPELARAWAGIRGALEGYAHDLDRHWTASCGLDARERSSTRRCLSECERALGELHELFAQGHRETLSQGWSLLKALPDPQACVAESAVSENDYRDWSVSIARADVLRRAGRSPQAREVLEELRAEIVAEQDPRALRRVDAELGRLAMHDGHYDAARRGLEAAFFDADGAGDSRAAADAAVTLVAQGLLAGELAAAVRWARIARSQLERVQPRDVVSEVQLSHNLSLVHMGQGDLPAALASIEEALEHAGSSIVPEAEREALHQTHAEILLYNGRPAEAVRIHEEVLHSEEERPDRDPSTWIIELQSYGNALLIQQDTKRAHAIYRQAYERGLSVLGPEHPTVASICIIYARTTGDTGEVEAGRRRLAPCLQRLRERLGEDHANVWLARAIEARLMGQAGEVDAAVAAFENVVAGLEQALGSEHYAVSDVLHELGVLQGTAGSPKEARERLERALRRRRAKLPPGHIDLAETMAALARLQYDAGEVESARDHLRAAIELFEARGIVDDYIEGWRKHLALMNAP